MSLSLSPPRHICPIATYMIGGVAPSLSPGIGNGGKSEMSGFMPSAGGKEIEVGVGEELPKRSANEPHTVTAELNGMSIEQTFTNRASPQI